MNRIKRIIRNIKIYPSVLNHRYHFRKWVKLKEKELDRELTVVEMLTRKIEAD